MTSLLQTSPNLVHADYCYSEFYFVECINVSRIYQVDCPFRNYGFVTFLYCCYFVQIERLQQCDDILR